MNKKEIQYIRILNFDENANSILNKAIRFSINEKCDEINTVHLFLALIEKTDFGTDILNHIEYNFDMVYSSYKMLASKGVYGICDNCLVDTEHTIDMDKMSTELFILLETVTARMAIRRKNVTPESLFNQLLEINSDCLNDFLEFIGLSIEDIKNIKMSKFSIPEQLASYVVDMNSENSKNNETISNVDSYIDTMIEVLSRKLEANPCLVGESGVGKTTIVRGLVQRLIKGEVPKQFKDTHIVYINSSLLSSGTRYRGDFEERMKCLIDWASKANVILFLDEIHTFINLGSNSNESADTAGNMIKKALSDGDIKIIGATTIQEYHKFIEQDNAFNRRQQVIDVKQPSIDTAISMIENTIKNYEDFHNVSVPRECIKCAVELSDRYIKDKALPAKAYKIIDQASTVVKLSNKKVVTEDDILNTVSKITGINVNKLNKSDNKRLITLEGTISKSLIGQENAVKTVCKAIRRAKAGVREENKPLASFMFVGPTGVGKTELCKVLSKEVAIGDTTLIKVDMSEYSEKHSISKLIGTAPGYIGYGEGGQLTEKVKHNPYSIVLFDEIEKAHPEVFNIFLQLLDEGKMTDGEGNTVDFTNCIIVMTSNAGYGAEKLGKGHIGFGTSVDEIDSNKTEKIAMEALKETFKPEFINRLDNIVIFEKLNEEQSKKIVELMLNKLSDRVYKNNKITITFGKSVVNRVASAGFSDDYGARNLRREIQNTIEDAISDKIIDETLVKNDKALVTWKNNKIIITKKED